MNQLLAIPIEVRLGALFLAGAVLGSIANLATYRLAWNRRSISPWSPPPTGAPPRGGFDRVPILGWLAMRREARWLGPGFWVRPLLVELTCGLGMAGLYYWEVENLGLFRPPLAGGPISPTVLHLQFLSHVVLFWLMLVASLIDVDEKLIPDAITVTGTLVGLALAAAVPWSLLPHVDFAPAAPAMGLAIANLGNGVLFHEFLTMSSPNPWPAVLEGAPNPISLAVGVGCYWLWCFAILPRPWYARHGWRRALRVASARLCRGLMAPVSIALVTGGTLAIAAVWWRGGESWAGMLSALVGMAGSGSLVWAVRLIGRATLRKEAMGFGDVTLMMMIGTFLGWQTCVIVFFIAPFAGLVVGVVQYIVLRDQVIPYGPFLCLAALVSILAWANIWQATHDMFRVSWLVPAAIAVCLAPMALVLLLMRLVRERLGG